MTEGPRSESGATTPAEEAGGAGPTPLIVTLVITAAAVGFVMAIQGASLLSGTGSLWAGVAIATGAAVAAFVTKAKRWIKVVTILLALGGLANTIYVEAELSSMRDDLGFWDSESTTDDEDAAESGSSFAEGVLTTPDMRIEITRNEVIDPGEEGNEYSEKPVIAFWYEITNISGEPLDATDFVMVMSAYQDNDPNSLNELQIDFFGPDESLAEHSTQQIKKGGTVEGAISYELDDKTTPVELVATPPFETREIGRTTYPLQ